MMTPILWQRISGGGRFGAPHDSTIGVGPGFYWFGLTVLLVIAIGVTKAWHEERTWRGRFIKFHDNRSFEQRRKEQHEAAMRINALSPREREALKKTLSKGLK